MSNTPVGSFFDALTTQYTAAIERCFPRYREMLATLMEETSSEVPLNSILELGCGTGNLSVLLASAHPTSALQLVDVSAESLETCRQRWDWPANVVWELNDFRDLAYPPASFDLIASSISIHHLTGDEKQSLFRRCQDWLRPGGRLVYADQFRGAAADTYQRHQDAWHHISLAAGATDAEFAMWQSHQCAHDHHDTLKDQFDWLHAAGFTFVDCTWRYLLWAVVTGITPA